MISRVDILYLLTRLN